MTESKILTEKKGGGEIKIESDNNDKFRLWTNFTNSISLFIIFTSTKLQQEISADKLNYEWL